MLIESGQFIGGVISSLFLRNKHIFLIEARPTNANELLNAVKESKPHIVVLDDTLNDEYLANLLDYMQNCEGLRVIVVNTNSNHLEVYQKQQFPVHKTADLFAVL